MTDVSKIQGPSGPPEGPGRKDKASADADKFKDEMRKRVTEVSAVDPDEKKKRKQAQETEEDDLNAPQSGPTTPTSQVTPFSTVEGSKMASPLDIQKGGAGTSPLDSAQPTQLPSVPKTAFFQAPASDEMSDDSGTLEEPSFGSSAPSAAADSQAALSSQQQATSAQADDQTAQTQQQTQQQQVQQQQQAQQQQQTGQQQTQTGWTPEGQLPVAPGPPESAGQQAGQQPGSGLPGGEEGAGGPGVALKGEQGKQAGGGKGGPGGGKPAQGMTAASLEGTQPSKVQDTSAFFEQMGKDQSGGGQKGKQGAQTPEEQEEEAAVQGAVAPGQPAPFAQVLGGEGETKVEGKEKSSGAAQGGAPMGIDQALAQAPEAPGVETLTPYAVMNPQVQDMFDRMAGVMTVMQSSGITETTITLNAPQFASSVFFGTQIIIQEFSTAPQAYNIQINGSAQAVALFQGNVDDLMAAFQSGNYNFRVNRLETGYLSERPLFKRKEKAAGDKQDQSGDKP